MTAISTMPIASTNLALEDDARARRRALEPASFIVQAPAGSGKTELLTQRFLALLARVDHPEEVVALTFTNKAAGEMRSRIVSSLRMAATQARPGSDLPHRQTTYDLASAVLERNQIRDWDLMGHPGRLKIMTIDSLCGSLVRQMPFLSRFGHQPQVEPDADRYYRIAAQETLALVEGGDANADCVRQALRYFQNDAGTLGSLLALMLAQRDQWHRLGAEAPHAQSRAHDGLAWLVSNILQDAARRIDASVQQTLMPAARFAATNNPELTALRDWTAVMTGQCEELPAWCALASLLLTSSGEFRRTLNKRNGFPAGDDKAGKLRAAVLALTETLPPEAASCLHGLRELPLPEDIHDSWEMVETIDRLLALAEAKLWLVFRDAGAVDFTAIAQHAIASLGTNAEPTDLALALDYRIRHLLIDEFQDTSPGQVALAAALTRGWEPGDGRTLFVVGDPMQSIYRFRKAEVGLFLDVARKGIGSISLEHLQLHRNNRSDPVIVDWVNRVFPTVFPIQADARMGAVSYASCTTDRQACGFADVAVHPFFADQEQEALGSDEASRIISIIDATRAARRDASIAVLVCARRHLDDLVASFRQLRPDLSYQAVEMEPLSGRQVIQDLLSLTHALSHRADRVHWLAILRAPWCGLTLDDLHRLAGDDHHSTIWRLAHDEARVATLSQDGQQRLRHVRAVLSGAFAHQGRQRPSPWLEQVWRQLGGAQCLSSAADLQDAKAYFALLEQCTHAGTIDAELLTERVEKLYSTPNPDTAARSLQLMTIHKSKGLEFDCVIVPGLGHGPKKQDRRLVYWEHVDVPAKGLCVVPAITSFKGSEDSAHEADAEGGADRVYKMLRGLEAEREHYEAQRLLYVAVTRARQTLHLLGSFKTEDDGTLKPAKGSLVALLWNSPAKDAFVEAAQALAANAAATGQHKTEDAFVAPLVRLRTAIVTGLASQRERSASNALAATVAELDQDTSGLSLDAATGTLVHRYLEMIANDGLAYWPLARCAGLEAACLAWFRSQGFTGQAASDAAQRVLQALRTVLQSDTGRWILDAHEQAHAEKPLTSRGQDGHGHANHIVDRTFVAAGERWIIDYKTVRCNDADPRAFLRAHAEKNYREQLERYAGLFATGELPIRAAIFYVLQGELIELDLKLSLQQRITA